MMFIEKIMQKLRGYQIALIVSLLSGFFIICKVFTSENCFAFDMNDDANHTFPNLYVAQLAFKLGQIPQINFFNNFGSPMLGDALTYPFAIHSLTYWFFASPMAMTVNRVIFAFFTIYLGYLFFKKYLKEFSSIVCSLLVFFSAVNVWFFTTYHMQLALFFEFSLLCLTQRQTVINARTTFAIFAVCVAMFLSLSINLSAFVLALVLASQFIDDRFKPSKKIALLLVSISSALIVTWFQFSDFIQGMINSSRLQNHYSVLATFDLPLLLKHMLFYYLERWHLDATVFLSIPVAICVIPGAFILYKQRKSFFPKVLLLGILLPLFCYTLMIFPSIWWSIPLFRSTDLTRVVWLALPFMFLSVGGIIDLLINNSFVRTWPKLLLVIYPLICYVFIKGDHYAVERGLGLSNMQVCRAGSHHFNLLKDSRMHPETMAFTMQPFSRLTSGEPSWYGNDFRGVYNQLLGSDQRAITSNQAFSDRLVNLNLIEIEDDPNKTYHFKAPWNAELMNQLGIRYIILNEKLDSKNTDWHLIKADEDKYLYENKFLSSPIYFTDHNKIIPLRTFKVAGNEIIIDLPKLNAPQELVATFLNLPGYSATIDGKPAKIFSPQEGFPFIHIQVNPGNQVLKLSFERYTWKNLLTFALAGLLTWSVGVFFILRFKLQRVTKSS